jgi:Protein of unknown function (DUF3014)
MGDVPDYELEKTPSGLIPAAPEPTRSIGPWICATLLIAAACAAAYVEFMRRPLPAVTPLATSTPATVREPPTLGGQAEPIPIPPLDASDAVVRKLVRALSESPAITAWLTTNDLIRNFTVVVANIGDGATPAKQLRVLRPSSAFRVVERNWNPYLDPRSYDRYAVIADAITSLDPAGTASLYATLKPRIEEAYRELGYPDRSFDRALERAIVAILKTPVLDGPVRLRPKGIGYAYADERLEDLTGAQKQLLRMGPQHVRIIKARIRQIGLALGISADQLPAL